MVLVVVLGASGIFAASPRPLTALAPASTAAVPRKPRREIMLLSFSVPAGFAWRFGHRPCCFIPRPGHPAAGDGRAQVRSRKPKVSLGVDRRGGRHDPLARFRQQ